MIEKVGENYLTEFWIFEELERFLVGGEKLEFSAYSTFYRIFDLNDEIWKNMFQVPRNVRSVIANICRSVIDTHREIDISKYYWLSTCCLPTTKLPESVFR